MTRVIALDPGTKRIGVAVSDSRRSIALPRPPIEAGDGAIDEIARVIAEVGATLVIVGRPTALSGSETAATAGSDRLISELTSSVAEVEFVPYDERLTTVAASRRLADAGLSEREQRPLVDSHAAAILLQSYLDATPA
jgi:putative pre-16S rRNA nuclease